MAEPIRELQDRLLREFERDPRGARIARLLAEYATKHEDWRRFALFDPDVYTRNLIARNEHFEMILLCWNVGQQSPIHNHAGQNCWMSVLEGDIEEILFSLPADGRPGPPKEIRSRIHVPGRVGFINDEIALHRVRPVAGRRGISLHLYSKPIEECNVYDEASGCIVRSRLVYHSVEGVATRSADSLLKR